MQYAETILDLIGNTPLVKLNRMADSRMATVLAKLEQYNPAGSVKDRMAWNMIRRAEEAGLLGPGSTLVESTSGNTGLGLAIVKKIMEDHNGDVTLEATADGGARARLVFPKDVQGGSLMRSAGHKLPGGPSGAG